jgi:hypothetical protein
VRRRAVVDGEWYWLAAPEYGPHPVCVQVLRATVGSPPNTFEERIVRGEFGIPRASGGRVYDTATIPEDAVLGQPYEHGKQAITLLCRIRPPARGADVA